MKSLQTLLALTLLALGLTACDPIEGTLQVLKPFTAKSGQPNKPCPDYEYPCLGNEEEVITVDAGFLSMKLEMFGADTAQIQLHTGGRERILELKVPRGQEIPDTGSFSLASNQTGQPFDLNGQTQTSVSTSPETHAQESCEVVYQEQVCGIRGNPPQYACWYETRYRPGIQEVSYYFKTTRQDMTAQILQNGSEVAQFQGGRSSTDKIYTYRGFCNPRGWR